MGVSFAPAILNLLMTVLTHTDIAGVHVHVHVGNVRFVGKDPASVQEAYDQFVQRCKDCNATLNDEPEVNVLHTSGSFMGPHHDYTTGEVSVAADSISKLTADADIVLRSATSTIEDVQVLFSRLFYCCALASPPRDTSLP